MKEITAAELKPLLEGENPPRLLDVREDWEFAIGHIDGAINLPMQQVPQRMSEIGRDAETVVICHHGARSEQVARFLEAQGFPELTNLTGGIDAWSRDVDPAVPTY